MTTISGTFEYMLYYDVDEHEHVAQILDNNLKSFELWGTEKQVTEACEKLDAGYGYLVSGHLGDSYYDNWINALVNCIEGKGKVYKPVGSVFKLIYSC